MRKRAKKGGPKPPALRPATPANQHRQPTGTATPAPPAWTEPDRDHTTQPTAAEPNPTAGRSTPGKPEPDTPPNQAGTPEANPTPRTTPEPPGRTRRRPTKQATEPQTAEPTTGTTSPTRTAEPEPTAATTPPPQTEQQPDPKTHRTPTPPNQRRTKQEQTWHNPQHRSSTTPPRNACRRPPRAGGGKGARSARPEAGKERSDAAPCGRRARGHAGSVRAHQPRRDAQRPGARRAAETPASMTRAAARLTHAKRRGSAFTRSLCPFGRADRSAAERGERGRGTRPRKRAGEARPRSGVAGRPACKGRDGATPASLQAA